MSDLVEYYRRRAWEYDEIYTWRDPHRQEEEEILAEAIRESLRERDVLEVASVTGYRTRILSNSARTITATDLGEEVMELAKKKDYGCPVTFRKEDAYDLSFEDSSFDGGLAFTWFSHIPRHRIDSFLRGFHRVLKQGSRIIMADNVYIPGLGGELVSENGDENTYKLRTLKDGSRFVIVKNYFTLGELVDIFRLHVPRFSEDNIYYGTCFWYVDYELR